MNTKYKVNTNQPMTINSTIAPFLTLRITRSNLGKRSFTLVEILVVVAVIGVLAGLVLGAAGGAQKKAARSQAQAQIRTMMVALERYRSDRGAYPEAITFSTTALFTNLTNYMAFKDSQTNQMGEILDPYGKGYRYRSPAVATRSMTSESFEIWSCGPDQKSDYDRPGATPGPNSRDDITSWQ
jgi:type II secretion system protein G